jgi:hypothetical protein
MQLATLLDQTLHEQEDADNAANGSGHNFNARPWQLSIERGERNSVGGGL